MIQLRSGAARALIDNNLGAGVAGLEVAGRLILSVGSGRVSGSPFAQGMNLLAPFSNRISRPFTFNGQTHAVSANLSGEPFAIHGDAFQKSWRILTQSSDRVTLALKGNISPFQYDARVTYVLSRDDFHVRLDMTNLAKFTLPYGGGFHPWFHRDAKTKLAFQADCHWPEDERHLPTTNAPIPSPSDWQFDQASSLPPRWINNTFSNWDGLAYIYQSEIDLKVKASGLATAVVYSPGADAPFFCFEPVSHPVDAHNLPGQPGLVPLAPGESLSFTLQLSWQASDRTSANKELLQ